MQNDESFEYLANSVSGSKVKVVFEEECNPRSDINKKIIYLPKSANNLPIEKRIELLCYLLHEIGHIANSNITPVSSQDHVYLNCLEDMRIQPIIEKYFYSSREIYEYTIKKIMKSKLSSQDLPAMTKIQRRLDHLIIKCTKLNGSEYDKDSASYIDSQYNPILGISQLYNNYHTSRAQECATRLRNIIEDGLSQQDINKLGELKKEKLSANYNKIDSNNAAIDKKQQKMSEDFDKNKSDITESQKRTTELKKQKEIAKANGDKPLIKKINSLLKQETILRQNARDNKDKLEEIIADNSLSEDKELHDLIDSNAELNKENQQIGSISIGTCCGLRNLDSGFFETRTTKFKQSTYASMRLLMNKIKDIIKSSDSGAINQKSLPCYYDADKLFKHEVPKSEISASVGFLLDSSGSMGNINKSNGKDSNFIICANVFINIARAMQKITSHEIANISWSAYSFSYNFEILKEFGKNLNNSHIEQAKQAYLKSPRGGTSITGSLSRMIEKINKQKGKKIIFIVTDGAFDNYDFLKAKWFINAKRQGIKMLVIGIGYAPREDIMGRANSLFFKSIDELNDCLSQELNKQFKMA